MSDKKIQVELTEEDARRFLGQLNPKGDVWLNPVRWAIEAALPPEYPEGTVAWVTAGSGRARHKAYLRRGQWWTMSGDNSSDLQPIWKVEPLRVLADDEIAVKHPGSIYLRPAADILERRNFVTTADWVRSVADALDAEATS